MKLSSVLGAVLAALAAAAASAQTFSSPGPQTFMVPVPGVYHIVAAGAQGGSATFYSSTGGLGAQIAGDFTLTAGQVLTVDVGGQGGSASDGGGGGGGTFVVLNGSTPTPLVIAAGGGGAGADVGPVNGGNGNAGPNGSPGVDSTGHAGMGGSAGSGGGGGTGISDNSGGGGGFLMSGTGGNGAGSGGGGQGFPAGLAGGSAGFNGGQGGYGGGGGGSFSTGGGGGGYSGGGGAFEGGGGGGGSLNTGANQTNTAGVNSGNGSVVITFVAHIVLNFTGSGVEDAFQVNYASQLNQADSVLNITNSGSSATATDPNTSPANTPGLGNICVNIYVFNPDEELEACCSCPVTPNELLSIAYIGSINGAAGLLSNTANPSKTDMANAVTKLVATTGTPCNNVRPAFGTPGNVTAALPITTGALAPGLTAWTTHAHPTNAPLNPNGTLPVNVTETRFVLENLSQGEANFLANTCATFVHNSSGAGICSCPTTVGGFVGR